MKKEVVFYSEGQKIAGDLYLPDDYQEGQKLATVVLCHGFAGIKELILPDYAQAFAGSGYAALCFDYRGFGASEGVRGRLVPQEQITDIRNAITFAQTCPEVDAEHIALWGSSFGGANAIGVAAIDKRVKCLAVQLTFSNGERMILGNQDEAGQVKLLQTLKKIWERTVTKNKVLALEPDQILTDEQSKTFYVEAVKQLPALKTKIPVFALQHIMEFKPEVLVKNVTAPIMILGASNDTVCPVLESERLHEQANEPKVLHVLEAEHYAIYQGETLKQSADKAVEWFKTHL
jgi:uncharacterized protein